MIKTNFVIFASVNKPLKNVTILLANKAIEEKKYVKYLGVLIDSRLTFKEHTSSVYKKIARTVGLLYKLRHYVNQKTLTMIYYSLIYPFLIYATPIWGNTHDIHLSPIHKLQKKVVRLVTFNDSYIKPPSAPLFNLLNILTIYDIFNPFQS